ncbi:TVP38/TMEM64 family protein [Tindallia californiensis]|uniref:TVP38/TMEM64 family membrane protein n=1 Tax=Tindallia californiensis TaxID=159292 RepID=A0A1H3QUS5_9FIRM|nr:VTT domain-containing protein [Tindallia californiensis]SDZ16748.1 Uncharacterized membrane protein YdjX, TVP38/TMEM64 family, SNARE-associated domain [Tindallia californiensis]
MSLHLNGKKIFQGFFALALFSAFSFHLRNPIDLFHWSQSNYKSFSHFVDQHLFLAMLIFFLVRFFFAVVSIPGTGVLTLLAGALFGFYIGSLLVLLAVSSGVLVAFLLTRYFFKEPLKNQFKKQFQYIDTLDLRYGSSLLFFLRLSEFTPSVVINSFFALTPMKASTYFRVSLISIVPGVLLFTNAGLQLSEIQQPSDFFNINILITLVFIGLLPILCEYLYLRHHHKLKV